MIQSVTYKYDISNTINLISFIYSEKDTVKFFNLKNVALERANKLISFHQELIVEQNYFLYSSGGTNILVIVNEH